ncbi:putative ubiquitin-protein ligase [Corchorus olitorius]|uniref:Ubiquitin-protein ligase n=1 Tax=Corchorus olitorius TaxID=93759 RepID=A0A1R3ITZ9_9ROSI|nr:putative ubiquitin-protein ligase [Corchorus olitorius]
MKEIPCVRENVVFSGVYGVNPGRRIVNKVSRVRERNRREPRTLWLLCFFRWRDCVPNGKRERVQPGHKMESACVYLSNADKLRRLLSWPW